MHYPATFTATPNNRIKPICASFASNKNPKTTTHFHITMTKRTRDESVGSQDAKRAKLTEKIPKNVIPVVKEIDINFSQQGQEITKNVIVESRIAESTGTNEGKDLIIYDSSGDDTSDHDGEKVKKPKCKISVNEEENILDLVLNNEIPEEIATTSQAQKEYSDEKKGDTTVEVAASKTTEEVVQEEWMKKCARDAIIIGLRIPYMLPTAGLNVPGDNIELNFNADGLEFRLSLKVTGEVPCDEEVGQVGSEAQKSSIAINSIENRANISIDTTQVGDVLQNTPPPSSGISPSIITYSTTAYKFGVACTKGVSCLFDHSYATTSKNKLCTFLNTAAGCGNGLNCPFSHENEGKMCSRSKWRTNCVNGTKCAFKHNDDGFMTKKIDVPRRPIKTSKPVRKAPTTHSSRDSSFVKAQEPAILGRLAIPTTPSEALASPRGVQVLGKSQSQQLAADNGDESQIAQRLRSNNNHQRPGKHAFQQQRGRGGGRGRGRGAATTRGGRGGRSGRGGTSSGIKTRGKGATSVYSS